MNSKLRDKIATELYRRYAMHCQYATDTWKDFIPAADSVLSLLAPELEKAQFLDDIIKRVDDKGCYEETGAGTSWCVLADTCDGKMWCRGIEAAFLTKRKVKDEQG
jgi:hypothetical protein